MARIPRRILRGTAAQVAAYNGPSGELDFDLDNGRLHVHDGINPGGVPHARMADLDPLDTRLDAAEADIDTLQGQLAGVQAFPGPPQGRLTLSSGVSVMTTAFAASPTVYYTPHVGQMAPLFNGTIMRMVDLGGELSQALTDNTKSPAAAANNSNYDLFVWDDAGTLRCTRGPVWASAIDRGTGAGTTEIELFQGYPVNKVAITNGPAARRGLYVGSIRTNASAQIDWSLGSGAAGGGIANLTVWNAFSQVDHFICVRETTTTWNYGSTTVRAMLASGNNRINLLTGLGSGQVDANLQCRIVSPPGGYGAIMIGVDSTTAMVVGATRALSVGIDSMPTSQYRGQVGLGWHFLQALEQASGSTQAFNGNGLDQAFTAVWAC